MSVLRSGPQLTSAFEAAYGAPGRIVRKGIDTERPDDFFAVIPSGLVITPTHFLLISQVRSYSDPLAALTESEDAGDVHAASGGLALHVFRNAGGTRGEITASAPFIGGGVGFGTPAPWEVRTDLLAGPVLLVRSGFGQQGCVVAYDVLYEPLLDVSTPRTEPILMRYQDPTADLTEARIDPVPQHDGFVVRYTGGITRVVRYMRMGDRYVPDTPQDELPAC